MRLLVISRLVWQCGWAQLGAVLHLRAWRRSRRSRYNVEPGFTSGKRDGSVTFLSPHHLLSILSQNFLSVKRLFLIIYRENCAGLHTHPGIKTSVLATPSLKAQLLYIHQMAVAKDKEGEHTSQPWLEYLDEELQDFEKGSIDEDATIIIRDILAANDISEATIKEAALRLDEYDKNVRLSYDPMVIHLVSDIAGNLLRSFQETMVHAARLIPYDNVLQDRLIQLLHELMKTPVRVGLPFVFHCSVNRNHQPYTNDE